MSSLNQKILCNGSYKWKSNWCKWNSVVFKLSELINNRNFFDSNKIRHNPIFKYTYSKAWFFGSISLKFFKIRNNFRPLLYSPSLPSLMPNIQMLTLKLFVRNRPSIQTHTNTIMKHLTELQPNPPANWNKLEPNQPLHNKVITATAPMVLNTVWAMWPMKMATNQPVTICQLLHQCQKQLHALSNGLPPIHNQLKSTRGFFHFNVIEKHKKMNKWRYFTHVTNCNATFVGKM